jgi:hypothetical protein
MPNKPLQPVSITSPGFFGLNSQEAGVGMNPSFALLTSNSIVDKSGRIAARKGWAYTTTSGGTSSSPKMMFEFDNFDGTNTIISAGNNKIFTGETTMTQANVRNTTNTANETVTITADNWQFLQAQYQSGLNRSPHGYMVQKSHPVLVYHKLPLTGTGAEVTVTAASGGSGHIQSVSITAAGSGYAVNDDCTVTGGTGTNATFRVLTVNGTGGVTSVSITEDGDDYTASDVLTLVDTDFHSHEGSLGFQRLADVGNVPTGYSVSTFQPNCGLAAFGRLWLANIGENKLTVYYSVLLDSSDFTGAGSGAINLEQVIPGNDEIVSLTEHNNSLIIFCKNNIVVYNNADDIGNIALGDTVIGIGCIARDSVQNIGTDLIFLSFSGLRTLGRTIQEKSAPLRDLSKNIRDNFLAVINGENLDNVKSVYYEPDAFYLLRTSAFVYCFDVRAFLEDGASRVTTWDTINPLSMLATKNRRLLLGKPDGIANYTNYTDNSSSYTFTYYTPYLDFGDPSLTKFPKKMIVTVLGSNVTFDVKWAFDYTSDFSVLQDTSSSANVAEYGVGEYNIAEYSSSIAIEQLQQQLNGNGNIIQIGIEALINGNAFSVQKIDIYSVIGRII